MKKNELAFICAVLFLLNTQTNLSAWDLNWLQVTTGNAIPETEDSEHPNYLILNTDEKNTATQEIKSTLNKEIERKFLVTNSSFKSEPESEIHLIKQGYLNTNPMNTAKIKVIEDKAYLTIESVNDDLTHNKFTYPMSIDDAQLILPSCKHGVIDEKTYEIRVRVCGDEGYLTIKSNNKSITRNEFNYSIDHHHAELMLNSCEPNIIIKKRYKIKMGDTCWDVDEFHGDNEGLVIAEIELKDEKQHFDIPPWLGDEVTGIHKYYNSELIKYPYRKWHTIASHSPENK